MTDEKFREAIADEVERVLGTEKAKRALLRYEGIWFSSDARKTTSHKIAEEIITAYKKSPGPGS